MGNLPVVHIALPAMGERKYLPKTLACISRQNLKGFHTWICVNQPESYHLHSEKKEICHNNAHTLDFLRDYPLENLHIIDRSSRGNGWEEGKLGVGMARKVLMDAIAKAASNEDIIVSMDADTEFGENYLTSVVTLFSKNPDTLALANPYYHPLADDHKLNRAMLRYEIYMRYYALNMRFIGTPYHFTPLGSAMASTVKAYRKIGGLTPKKSGEDFYFLQKMVKAGKVLTYNTETVYPGNRLSDRVFFGTGPALIKGMSGEWEAYPLFPLQHFQEVKQTIDLFPELLHGPKETPMDAFLARQFKTPDIYEPLRKNHKTPEKFIKACHEKIDGLRILQFLKVRYAEEPDRDDNTLKKFLLTHFECKNIEKELKNLDFSLSPMEGIDKIRNFLFQNELSIRKDDTEKNQQKL